MLFSGSVRLSRFLRRCEDPKAAPFAINSDLSAPTGAMRRDTAEPGFIVPARFGLIESVLGVGRVVQIGDAIISLDLVQVINLARRPDPIDVQPRKSMSQRSFAVHADGPVITASARPASNIANVYRVGRPDLPSELSGGRVVIQQFSQSHGIHRAM